MSPVIRSNPGPLFGFGSFFVSLATSLDVTGAGFSDNLFGYKQLLYIIINYSI